MSKQKDLHMGRYRLLYESYVDGKRINQISLEAEAFFWRIYVKADDYGNFPADPQLVRNQTAGRRPVTEKQIAGWIKEMESKGLIRLYLDRDDWYLHILSFTKMQPPMGGPRGRRYRRYPPAPWESEQNNYMPLLESSEARPDPASPSDGDNNNYNNNNSSLSKEQKDYTRVRGLDKKTFVEEGFLYWLKKMKMNANTKLSPERAKKLEARWNDSTFEELRLAVDGCESSDFHMGRQPNNPATYNDILIICRNRAKLEWFRDKVAKRLFKPEEKKRKQDEIERRWRGNDDDVRPPDAE